MKALFLFPLLLLIGAEPAKPKPPERLQAVSRADLGKLTTGGIPTTAWILRDSKTSREWLVIDAVSDNRLYVQEISEGQ